MTYRDYVIAAYAIFAGMLLWDYLVPKLHIRWLLRAAKQRATRNAATSLQHAAEPLSRD